MQDLKQFRSVQYANELFSQLPIIVFAVLLFCGLSVGVLSSSFEMLGLGLWFLYMVVIGVGRLVLGYLFSNAKNKNATSAYWVKLFAAGTLLSSSGIAYVFFVYFDPYNDLTSLYMAMLFSAFIASNSAATGFHLRIYLLSATPVTLAVVANLIFEDSSENIVVIITVVMLYLAMFAFTKKVNDRFMNKVEWAYERFKLERELRDRTDQAEGVTILAENEAIEKAEFLAAISHDLKQPLHAIGLFHDSLRNTLQCPESLEILEKASRSTRGLNEKLLGMLDISQLDTKKTVNNPSTFEVNNVLSELCAEFKNKAVQKGLEFQLNVEAGWYVFLDKDLFERLIYNLLDNAVKYTDSGFIDVSLCKAYDSHYYELHVKDSGQGIPAGKLKDIFIEFSQVDNPALTRKKGLGLGLTIVKKMCHLMGLEIRLDSEEGYGTKVVLDLPVATVYTTPGLSKQFKNQSKDESKKVEHVENSKSMAMIIEDNNDVLDAMTMLLETLDFTVLQATNATQAMTLFAESRPNLIISDFRLPGDLDGLTLLKRFQSLSDNQVAAILVTGETSVERLQLTADSGLKVLYKPVDADVLQTAINEVTLETCS